LSRGPRPDPPKHSAGQQIEKTPLPDTTLRAWQPLRKEIAHIQALNDMESRSAPYQNRDVVRQRRAERLKEIMAELRTLTEWKKP
jgi:hypothetical protein